MSETKKYYWLKLKRDFFKRHDIKIIESMENGKDYVLFYMKLLLESIDHEGELRFSETIPYNDKMLATITDTNIDIVRSAVKVFAELGMMEQMDDGTLFMAQVTAMTGYETSDAIRMRRVRQEKKQPQITDGEQCSESFKNRSPELEKEIEKEIEKEPEKEDQAEPDPLCTPAIEMANLLYDLHRQQDDKYKITPQARDKWAADIEKLNRIDGRDYQDIEKVIRWIKQPSSFWFPNIMSGKKLREKFPTILAQIQRADKSDPVKKKLDDRVMLDL